VIERDTYIETADGAAWERLHSVVRPSADATLRWAVIEFEDDCGMVPQDEWWDYVQRYLLLLRSDAEMVVTRRYGWGQALAIICGVGLAVGYATIWRGRGFLVWCIAGLVGGLIASVQTRSEGRTWWPNEALAPFETAGDMLRVLRTVPGFRKLRYPGTRHPGWGPPSWAGALLCPVGAAEVAVLGLWVFVPLLMPTETIAFVTPEAGPVGSRCGERPE
jgi:hypothetical protein